MRTRSLVRRTLTLVAVATVVAVATPVTLVATPAAAAPSIGTLIDDSNITTEVKAKLAAERLSTLTRISVSTTNGTVYLTGTADTPDERVRAANVAASVRGVKEVVNNIQVAAARAPSPSTGQAGSSGSASPTVPPAPSSTVTPSSAAAASSAFEATGTVAKVDRQNHTITLQDGRVLRATDQTRLWQPTTIQSVQPGATIFVRNAEPVAFEPPAGSAAWRMGTVSRVDTATNRILLTDGSTLQIGSSTLLHRGDQQVTLAQVQPGSEIVARVPRNTEATARTPKPTTTSTEMTGILPAVDVEIVWPPLAAR